MALAVACAGLFATASPASAGVGFLVVPNVPSPLAVGQVAVPASLTITNGSNGAEAALNVAVNAITLVPSCGTQVISSGDCPAAAVDPGVLRLSATGVGEAGSVCAGTTFTNSIVDAAQGKYSFVPSAPFSLGPTGGATATCIIDFTVDVVKAPTKDADAVSAGLQTDQTGFSSGVATDGQPGGGFGTNQVTINLGTVTVTTVVTPATLPLGSSFQDTATLTSTPGAAAPTGTVTFNVYGPGDTTCTGPVLFTSTNPVNAAGTTATSAMFTPGGAGTYRVIATYSGDANYHGLASACGDPTEAVMVTKAPLPVTTQVQPPNLPLGSSFTDTATLGPKPAGGPTPTGTVTFNVYGPGDTTCAGPVLFTSTNQVDAAGVTATSGMFTPGGVGTYRVIATYSGDTNYAGSASACGDPKEAVVVSKVLLPVTTQVQPPNLPLGSTFTDTATLGPKPTGGPTPTGMVTFNVYGPGDTTCAGPVLFTSTNPVNAAGTTATSTTFTPGGVGTYRVIATYSGDANYAGSASLCGDPTEAVVVSKAPLPVTTQVQPPNLPLGSTFTDTATLGPKPAGGPTPTGTVTFNVYGPGDTTCAGPVLFTSTNPLNAAGTTATSATFTPGAPGTYLVIATYSGDPSYAGSASGCGDPTEAVVVAKAPLPVTTQVQPPNLPLGSTFTDTATLGPKPTGGPTPTGTVTFNVYGPGDTTCAGPVLFTSTNPVNAAGTTATSATFTPGAPGTYRVVATYSGDATYAGSASTCGDPTEAVVVAAPPPGAPQIAVSKAASPASRPAPGGAFTFTVAVSNPSTTTSVTITKLTDNVYGDLATRPLSSCGVLIGTTLAPGATSAPCVFTGSFSGSAGASQTDVVTVTGASNGVTVTASAHATVTLTPPVTPLTPLALHGPSACVSTTRFKVYVTGLSVQSVTYYLDGKRIATVTKRDALGRLSLTINPIPLTAGRTHHLTAVAAPVPHSGQPVRTVRRTFAVCGKPALPRFTG